ncbi:1-acyl-sn-glycerol-3-phosphate acyltransferase [Fulvitalea axinellae]|uniref:1-acyl-sn-glycerol-3-phosphate acyltransferase n=1 Tax=Fulvitalea axinellae TaxID=1182444 RepID=A0AAU9CXT8_9BACT|nr:1-acyl-sn-glycerol-3-phosphate acyltransferase [Fulvitalea axinellae]
MSRVVKFFKGCYTAYGLSMFLLVMLCLAPFFWIASLRKSWRPFAEKLFQIWGTAVQILIGMPVRRTFKAPLDRKGQYIFAPNHSSFLDIPMIGSGPFPVVFLGKASLAKVPVFGFIYKSFNVLVDRKSSVSRAGALDKCRKELDAGRNLVVFPEGTQSREAPKMRAFKDGAFLLAIEKQIPVVPVTFPNNWKILPPLGNGFYMAWNVARVIFHEPISTKGMTNEDIPELKAKVKGIIEAELKKYNG